MIGCRLAEIWRWLSSSTQPSFELMLALERVTEKWNLVDLDLEHNNQNFIEVGKPDVKSSYRGEIEFYP